MSCDWAVWCKDCNESLVGEYCDWNHDDRTCWKIIELAPALAILGAADVGVTVEVDCRSFCPAPFADHVGHRLMPRDEYGRWADQCPKYFKCNAGHSHNCQLALDHDGEHGPKETR